jgi:hypothetical protein
LRINVIDVDGFISQCELSFSNGESVQSAEVVSVSTNESVSFCQMLEIFKLIKSKYVIIFYLFNWPKGPYDLLPSLCVRRPSVHCYSAYFTCWSYSLNARPTESKLYSNDVCDIIYKYSPFHLDPGKTWPSWAICVCLSYDPQTSNENVPISNLVCTMRFWNNLHQVRSK